MLTKRLHEIKPALTRTRCNRCSGWIVSRLGRTDIILSRAIAAHLINNLELLFGGSLKNHLDALLAYDRRALLNVRILSFKLLSHFVILWDGACHTLKLLYHNSTILCFVKLIRCVLEH